METNIEYKIKELEEKIKNSPQDQNSQENLFKFLEEGLSLLEKLNKEIND